MSSHSILPGDVYNRPKYGTREDGLVKTPEKGRYRADSMRSL